MLALWRQVLADALGIEVGFALGREGSSFGAALLGMCALGLIADLETAAELVTIDCVHRPNAVAASTYRSLLPVFRDLYGALAPTSRALSAIGATTA